MLLWSDRNSYGQSPLRNISEPEIAASQTANSGSPDARRKYAGLEAPDQPPSTLAKAKSLLDEGKLHEAELAVRQYLVQYPNSGDAHFLLGYVLFRLIQAQALSAAGLDAASPHGADVSDTKFRDAKAKESLAAYTEGAKYQNPSALDLKIVALDYVLLQDYTDADKWLTKSLEWNPKDAEGWYYLGRTKYNENRFEEAINAFEQCLKLDPGNVKAEHNLGLSYAGLGRTEEAINAYKKAMDWQTQAANKNPGPFIDLGSLLLEQNQAENAVAYLLQAVEIAPREFSAHEQLGKAYSHLNQLQKAQSELEKAVELAPQIARLHFLLGQVYRRQGLIDKAKAELDRFAKLNGAHSLPVNPER
jgi:Flp pilus assembly protein TadD